MSLAAIPDGLGGVVVDATRLPKTVPAFELALATALKSWRKSDRTHAWLTIPRRQAALIPVATAAGFDFHQAQPDALTLVVRLQPDVVLPRPGTHTIHVSGAVVTDENELLVVKPRGHSSDAFGLPGGWVQAGEMVISAVVDRVQRQTGIETEFGALLGVRHQLTESANSASLSFVALLDPVSYEIERQKRNSAEVQWMPVQSFLNHPGVNALNKRYARLARGGMGWSTRQLSGYRFNPQVTELIIGSINWERRHRVTLLFYRDGELLLMRRIRDGRTYYILPGGGVDPGESFEEAALREAIEETNLSLTLGPEIETPPRRDFVDHTFLVTAFEGTPTLGGPELARQAANNVYEFAWVPLEQVNQLVAYPGPVNISAVRAALAS